MQFQVPQFIEIEDKIFGPLTFKQFLYVAGAGGLSFILYTFLPFYLAILLIIPVAGFFLALAFYKHNDRPFIVLVEAAFQYFGGGKLYIWKKEHKKKPFVKAAGGIAADVTQYVPTLSESKLNDLAWSLDIKERGNEES
jgi:hypothetical protein